MEPTRPQPDAFPERQPRAASEQQPFRPEMAPVTPEKEDETRERVNGAGAGDAAPTTVQPAPLPPLPAPAQPPAPVPTSGVSGAPLYAADDDLIEKEWVDKAKKIIADTKHDPYLQEREVGKLQADYLQKRYGKSVKQPESK